MSQEPATNYLRTHAAADPDPNVKQHATKDEPTFLQNWKGEKNSIL